MIKVFYDGSCGICSKEIQYYRRLAKENNFSWIDITDSSINTQIELEGVTLEQALRSLHVKDHDGSLYKGVDAFILIWKNMPYWKLLGFITSLPIVYNFAKFLYLIFSTWRFKRLKKCNLPKK